MRKIFFIFVVVQIVALCFFVASDGVNTVFGAIKAIQTAQGGTGTVTIPTNGQVLVGQPDGTYAPQATSTLGISGENYLTNDGVNTYLNTGTNLQAPTINATSTATSTFTGGLSLASIFSSVKAWLTDLFVSGSASITGNLTVTGTSTLGTTTTASLNGVVYVGTNTNYPFTDVGVQAAINNLPDTGGIVMLPCNATSTSWATYVTILKSNTTVQGCGRGTTIYLDDEVNREVFIVGDGVTSVNNVSFKDFKADGNKAHQTAGSCSGTGCTRNVIRYRSDAQNSYGGVVEGLWITGGKQNGLSIESHAFITVSDLRTEYNDGFGIWVENTGNNTIGPNIYTFKNAMGGVKGYAVSGTSFIGINTKGDTAGGIALLTGHGNIVSDNVVYRAGWSADSIFTEAHGITLSDQDAAVVSNNIIYGSYGHGMTMYDVASSSITGNSFERNGQYATDTYSDIFMGNTGSDRNVGNVIANNVFDNATTSFYDKRTAYNIGVNTTGNWGNMIQGNVFGAPATARVNSNLYNTDNTPGLIDNQIGMNDGLNPHRYYSLGYCGSTQNLDYTLADFFFCAGYYSTTNITIPNGLYRGQEIKLKFEQDAGNKVLTFGTNIALPVKFTTALAANAYDMLTFIWDGSFWKMEEHEQSITPSMYAGYFVATTTNATSTFAGAVGIGTTSPSTQLGVHGTIMTGSIIATTSALITPTISSSTTWPLYINYGTAISGTGQGIVGYGPRLYGNAAGSIGYLGYTMAMDTSSGNVSSSIRLARTPSTVYLGLEFITQSRDGVRFLNSNTTPVEVMRLDASGKLGIGTTSPYAKLSVAGDMVAGTINATSTTASSSLQAITATAFGILGSFFADATKFVVQVVTTFTNSVNFNGAVAFFSNFAVGTSTNPTMSNINNLSINTTAASSSIRYYDGTAERALYPITERSFSFASSTLDYMGDFGAAGTTTILLMNSDRPLTLTDIYCKTNTGTTTIAFSDGTNYTDYIQCNSTGAEDDGTIANNTWVRREDFKVSIGMSVGTPSNIIVTAGIRTDAD